MRSVPKSILLPLYSWLMQIRIQVLAPYSIALTLPFTSTCIILSSLTLPHNSIPCSLLWVLNFKKTYLHDTFLHNTFKQCSQKISTEAFTQFSSSLPFLTTILPVFINYPITESCPLFKILNKLLHNVLFILHLYMVAQKGSISTISVPLLSLGFLIQKIIIHNYSFCLTLLF